MKIDKLRSAMKKTGADAALIASEVNVQYYSGFTGDSSQLLITQDEMLFFTDFRYTEQAQMQTSFNVIETKGQTRLQQIFDSVKKAGAKTLGIDLDGVMYPSYKSYSKFIDEDKIIDLSAAVGVARCVKDDAEIAAITKGAQHNDKLFAKVCTMIEAGVTEADIKAELIYYMNKNGAEAAFDPIVASGSNSSLPHATPTSKKFVSGDFVTMDYGCKFGGYCSDFTRTVVVGKVDNEQQKVYDTVKTAGDLATKALAPGVKCSDIDAIARDYITSKGYGEYFGHGLGHGVGRNIHEAPSLNATGEIVLEAGMVITIEPGIYLPGKWGVRIEDLCVITEDGYENLTAAPRDLIII
ncbi:MAG: aminopeptidase P family protein [Clostridia bacterium]|jgi:Xaa-Pro aminopeptidase|nr:aminopeptidase P family protein [Clostridia bacterium]MBT7122464.1 aminopeptidase P family protein [Clostridia bacterium]